MAKNLETKLKFEGPLELPFPEDVLKELCVGIKTLSQPGLPVTEIRRWRKIVKKAGIYNRILKLYTKYREFEIDAIEQAIKREEATKNT